MVVKQNKTLIKSFPNIDKASPIFLGTGSNKNTNKEQMKLTTNRLITTRAGLGNRDVGLTTPARSPPTVLGLCLNQVSFV